MEKGACPSGIFHGCSNDSHNFFVFTAPPQPCPIFGDTDVMVREKSHRLYFGTSRAKEGARKAN